MLFEELTKDYNNTFINVNDLDTKNCVSVNSLDDLMIVEDKILYMENGYDEKLAFSIDYYMNEYYRRKNCFEIDLFHYYYSNVYKYVCDVINKDVKLINRFKRRYPNIDPNYNHAVKCVFKTLNHDLYFCYVKDEPGCEVRLNKLEDIYTKAAKEFVDEDIAIFTKVKKIIDAYCEKYSKCLFNKTKDKVITECAVNMVDEFEEKFDLDTLKNLITKEFMLLDDANFI